MPISVVLVFTHSASLQLALLITRNHDWHTGSAEVEQDQFKETAPMRTVTDVTKELFGIKGLTVSDVNEGMS